jgi:lysophospholipid acyltransferase (LPLAT)-like uncharacterized protein
MSRGVRRPAARSAAPKPPDLGRRLLALLARWFIVVLGWTYRSRVIAGADVIERIVAGERPVIFCVWHDGIVYWGPYFRRLHRRGVPLTIFTSMSRDGELVAQLALAWGAQVVRGSSSRGGTEALRLLRRTLAEGRSPVVVPDGPKGPPRAAKPGVVTLSRIAARPCVPLAWAARRGWQLSTWDRLRVPRPFTRVAVAVGEPLAVGDAGGDAEAWRQRLEQSLEALHRSAEAAVA